VRISQRFSPMVEPEKADARRDAIEKSLANLTPPRHPGDSRRVRLDVAFAIVTGAGKGIGEGRAGAADSRREVCGGTQAPPTTYATPPPPNTNIDDGRADGVHSVAAASPSPPDVMVTEQLEACRGKRSGFGRVDTS